MNMLRLEYILELRRLKAKRQSWRQISPRLMKAPAMSATSEAFNLVCSNVQVVGVEEISLDLCVGRIAAEDLVALVSYPSSDVSLKDGFAVRSGDVADASRTAAGMPAGDWLGVCWLQI